ncbi:hypothetical protein [Roseospira navarrensis]|uniref:Uncharacterized protein n=1 Tax=Roseospira navarrensis TaxID=140058 RepID=A0A7X1ZDL4_9PROT|nr:hypothetical protein [Roseospira navarrensis]MQX36605.1 hypothetical protein [Roseospira navarrensis]
MRGAGRLAFGLALGLSLALVTGCGRKAPNLPPEGSTYPRVYPTPRVLDEPRPEEGRPRSSIIDPRSVDRTQPVY